MSTPTDDRYKDYVGKQCIVPMSGGRTIPILADDYVDVEFGTGALKVTPGHDANDYAIGQRNNLPIINIMDEKGALNENGGAYAGWIGLSVGNSCGRIWRMRAWS